MLLFHQLKLLHFNLVLSSRSRLATPFEDTMTPKPNCSLNAAPPLRPTNRWCVTAAWDEVSNRVISQNVDYPIQTINEKVLDLTTSPDWMEYLEISEHRSEESGGAGAYDSFRCDLILQSTGQKQSWRIWGQDFHLNRIQESYQSIAKDVNVGSLMDARHKSELIIQELLSKASTSPTLLQLENNSSGNAMFQLIRMTLLWSNANGEITVRGHSCCSGSALSLDEPVQPIVVSVAAKQHGKQIDMDSAMPSRVNDPRHKVASWTRLRKQLERPETYKPPGTSEVLMLRPSTDHRLEVLEGLSSNFFVVYKDGTLRTASDGVLLGYARHLVLECAESCGLRFISSKSIFLQDAEQGLWQEAFITSSSRLIYPISKVIIHTDNEMEFEDYWTYESNGEKAKWQQLLDEILKRRNAEITTV
ncbi:hypothetical protein FisN_1Hh426 [Fistulifera solaris]|uniref:PH domain-containing protein n=1 Tax=Fistulifera solaris TaxID=1519565 RepID=A0A1Z5JJS2_FISSO|nr:hypothetical protein FisN_1Hh426 [Fistulifera solaris]|eukprot:GAX14234.1 hypothetical protein FisN_1Hh426 [Fistulifera solaris]